MSFREDGYTADSEEVALALNETGEKIREGLSTVWRAVDPSRPYPVGMIEVRPCDVPPIGEHTLLARLIVLPSYRNRGIAGKLVRAALGEIGDNEVLLAMTWGDLRRSYRRAGAVKVGEVIAARAGEVKVRLNRGR